jgi:assimilatory nitrate reductase catalytic subunit
MHWTGRQSTGGRTGLLTRPRTDPVSGQPGFKSTPVRAEKVAIDWRGFLIAHDLPETIDALYATRVRVAQGWLVELAGIGDPAGMIRQLLPSGERLEARDAARGQAHYAVLAEGRLRAALFLSRTGKLPPRDWLAAQLAASAVATPSELLAGRPARPAMDEGSIVCACFDIGTRTLVRAIADQRLISVEQVGIALRAGTNCGSCRPAIRNLLQRAG